MKVQTLVPECIRSVCAAGLRSDAVCLVAGMLVFSMCHEALCVHRGAFSPGESTSWSPKALWDPTQKVGNDLWNQASTLNWSEFLSSSCCFKMLVALDNGWGLWKRYRRCPMWTAMSATLCFQVFDGLASGKITNVEFANTLKLPHPFGLFMYLLWF